MKMQALEINRLEPNCKPAHPANSDIEQVRAALEEIGKLIDLIDCTDKHNLSLLPLFLEQQKRALAALTRMEQP